jgi:hypothetical protein
MYSTYGHSAGTRDFCLALAALNAEERDRLTKLAFLGLNNVIFIIFKGG